MIRAARNLLLVALIVLPATCGQACIWVKGSTVEGHLGMAEPVWSRESGWMVAETKESRDPTSQADALRRLAALTPAQFHKWLASSGRTMPEDWPHGLDAAVEPLFGNDPEDAVRRLTALQETHPGNYFIHANLGVALELAGRDQEALENVETALRIDPEAHRGTEWMHAAVLRAKIALAKDPAWLDSHTISGIPLGPIPRRFELTDGSRTLSLQDIHRAIFAHALPRVLFTKPPNQVTAALLKELARVEGRGWLVEGGLAVLGVAEQYGAKDTAGLREEWKSAISERRRMQFVRFLGIVIPPLLGLLTIIWVVRRWLKNRNDTWRRAC